jgi:hypothetical protein
LEQLWVLLEIKKVIMEDIYFMSNINHFGNANGNNSHKIKGKKWAYLKKKFEVDIFNSFKVDHVHTNLNMNVWMLTLTPTVECMG